MTENKEVNNERMTTSNYREEEIEREEGEDDHGIFQERRSSENRENIA